MPIRWIEVRGARALSPGIGAQRLSVVLQCGPHIPLQAGLPRSQPLRLLPRQRMPSTALRQTFAAMLANFRWRQAVIMAVVARRGSVDRLGGSRQTRNHLNELPKVGGPLQGVDGAYHNSYIIADARKAWVLETAGTHWVAKRFDKGTTSISNDISLGSDYQLCSAGLVEHAVEKEWWSAESSDPFDFEIAYSKTSRRRAHPRATRSRSLLQEKSGEIDVRWMMRIARDRAGLPSIDQEGTASSCVAVLPDTDDQLPVFWWCPSVPSNSCYVPFFIHGSGLPENRGRMPLRRHHGLNLSQENWGPWSETRCLGFAPAVEITRPRKARTA
jgi:hypothetical protein